MRQLHESMYDAWDDARDVHMMLFHAKSATCCDVAGRSHSAGFLSVA
jgi:hypothetical protein